MKFVRVSDIIDKLFESVKNKPKLGRVVSISESTWMSFCDAVVEIEQENKQLKKERDLAIAHDTQPYPTVFAYEQSCKSNNDKADEIIKLKAENENLRKIIAKELSENDEFVHVNILKEKLRIAVDALKEIRDYDSGQSYAYCVGFLQEKARGALEKIEGEK